MKSYKLIRKYPGSPKLNTIYIWDEVQKSYNNIDKFHEFTRDLHLIENYPEYWELVIEKDYEILSISLHRSDKPKITNMIGCSEDYILSLLNCNGNSIHSVKRL